MACTSRGYKGAATGVRIGAVNDVDVGDYEWVLPRTEEGWKRCERKWETRTRGKGKGRATTSRYWADKPDSHQGSGQGTSPQKRDLVREKVESWKAKIVHDVDRNTRSLGSSQPNLKGGNGEPSKAQASLEFQVAKRPTSTFSDANHIRKGTSYISPERPLGALMHPKEGNSTLLG